jgi:hypothetical protein
MPRMVLELLTTSWGVSFGYDLVKEVWRLVLLCLMWCILRKRLLNMLYIWIASHHSVNVFTYANFLNLFSIRSY